MQVQEEKLKVQNSKLQEKKDEEPKERIVRSKSNEPRGLRNLICGYDVPIL